MPSQIAAAVLFVVTLLSVAVTNADAEAAESHNHGAHDQAGLSAISAAIDSASGLKTGEPATLTLSLTKKTAHR